MYMPTHNQIDQFSTDMAMAFASAGVECVDKGILTPNQFIQVLAITYSAFTKIAATRGEIPLEVTVAQFRDTFKVALEDVTGMESISK